MLKPLICLLMMISSSCLLMGQSGKCPVYIDRSGVVRWTSTHKEATFFGVNYCLPSSTDYRAAGYLGLDRKQLVREDVYAFKRMGFNAVRLSFWGDFENSDSLGHLKANDHLDLMDYLIAEGSRKGLYFLLSPIVTYDAQWPDQENLSKRDSGFSNFFRKDALGVNRKAIAAQCLYLRELLVHRNPYTGHLLKDEPNLIFIEMINEPTHHPQDVAGSLSYIKRLEQAVRATGSNSILFHNLTQDFKMLSIIAKSDIQGFTMGWYPSGLNSGDSLPGNYLTRVDHYDKRVNDPTLLKKPRLVYEFDSPDIISGYMYPAMARAFREVGACWATMFSYDMLGTAPYNLGWQTHCLNMVYTPDKAISAMIAAEVMHRIPRSVDYGNYPANSRFGDFFLSYEQNLGLLNSSDCFYYTASNGIEPKNLQELRHIAGVGSSSVVGYNGLGLYFLDQVRKGLWRLELYPDVVKIADPFNMPSADKRVFRLQSSSHLMHLRLPDLSDSFYVAGNGLAEMQADSGCVSLLPGVYYLAHERGFLQGQLQTSDTLMLPNVSQPSFDVVVSAVKSYRLNRPVVISALVVGQKAPKHVTLYARMVGSDRYMAYPMIHTEASGAYTYTAELPLNLLHAGWIEYCIVVQDNQYRINMPGKGTLDPDDWNFNGCETWRSQLVDAATPLKLFDALRDQPRLAFTRIDEGWKSGIYSIEPASDKGEAVLCFSMPSFGNLKDYTASVSVKQMILERKLDLDSAVSLLVHAKGKSAAQIVLLSLVEKDGTTWSAELPLSSEFQDIEIPLNQFHLSKGVMLPEGFPGTWNYFLKTPSNRGGQSDNLHLQNVEWLQFSIRKDDEREQTDKSFLEVSSVILKMD